MVSAGHAYSVAFLCTYIMYQLNKGNYAGKYDPDQVFT
jgi:hypothetical protein